MSTESQHTPRHGDQVSTTHEGGSFGQQLDSHLATFRALNKELRDRKEKVQQAEEEQSENEQAVAAFLAEKKKEVAKKRKQLEKDLAQHHRNYNIIQHDPAPAPAPSTPSTDGAPDQAADPKLTAKFNKLKNELEIDAANGKDRKAIVLLSLAGFKTTDMSKVYSQLGVAPGTKLTHPVLVNAVTRYFFPTASAEEDDTDTEGTPPSAIGRIMGLIEGRFNS